MFLVSASLSTAQVIIGDAIGAAPTKTSVILEFAANQNKGIIVPYVRTLPVASAQNRGTILLDASDATKARFKFSTETDWVDLSGQDADVSAVLLTQPVASASTVAASAKTIIGATSSTADGVLVLESNTKAMVLPTVTDVQNIPKPSPGMMVYVTGVEPTFIKRLAVFNGSKWSYWRP